MFKRYIVRGFVLLLIPAAFSIGIPTVGMAQDASEPIKLKAESSEDAQDVYADGASYQNGGKFDLLPDERLESTRN